MKLLTRPDSWGRYSSRMKLLEAWRYSRVPYKEVVYRSIAEEKGRMWWGGFGRGRLSADQMNNLELTKKALRIAKWDKLLVAIFNVLAAVIPFTAQFFGSPLLGLTSAVSLSLAVTFGFTALYAIQTLSSFVSAESSVLLATLPIEQNDFSLVTLLSFVRSVDYMVVGSIASQVALVAYHTGSPVAVLVMLVASVVNAILAVAASLWFSRVFTKNLSQGGRSKSSTVLRLLFILMWGSLLLGVSFLISLPWYIVPSLELMFLSSTQLPSTFLSLVYPFSAGIIIASINNPIAAGSMALIAAISMIAYLILAGFAGKWILKTVKQISYGTDAKQSRMITKDFSIKIHKPLFGFIMKDLKISSRNPATAFFFALPVLETAIVSFLSLNLDVLRASTLLVSTFMGGIFVLLMPLALLNSEGQGLEYTKTLPLDVNRIILSKTLISTLTYIPVPMVLCIMAFLKPLTSPLALLIPFFVILSIASASIFEIQLFLKTVTKGKISALIHDLKKLVVGVTTLLIPIVAYSIIYIVSFSHFFAVLSMSGAEVSMLAIAIYQLQQNKKQ
jgi:predicted permease